MNVIDYLVETIFRNGLGRKMCHELKWGCPFNPGIEGDQDPNGTICKNFLREHLKADLEDSLKLDIKGVSN